MIRSVNSQTNLMIKNVRLNGADVTDGFEIRTEDIRDLEIEVTNRLAQISGAVTNTRGEPVVDYSVVAFPQDVERWRNPTSGRTAMVRSEPDGRFSIRMLRPGDYYVIAVDHVENGQWNDPEYLSGLRDRAQRVAISDTGTHTIALRLAPQ